MRTRRGLALAAAMLTLAVPLAGCGGDDDATTPAGAPTATTEAEAPEDRIAPDSEVSAGLTALKRVAATVGVAPDGETAKAAAEGLEPVWEPVEGTVKKNEPDLYLDIEDSFQRLQSGDPENAKKGRQALDRAVDAYLARHPG